MGKLIPTIVGIILQVGIPYLLYSTETTFSPEVTTVLVLIIPAFIAGLLARSDGDGASSGFLTVFIPMFVFSILLIFNALSLLSSPVSNILEVVFVGLGGILTLISGIFLVIFSVILGILGAIIGAIGGFITGKFAPSD